MSNKYIKIYRYILINLTWNILISKNSRSSSTIKIHIISTLSVKISHSLFMLKPSQQLFPHIINYVLDFPLTTTSSQHFSLPKINLLRFFKLVIFLFYSDSGNWNDDSFCKLFITDFYVLTDIFQSNRLFDSHQQLSSVWFRLTCTVTLKSLFIDCFILSFMKISLALNCSLN